MVSDSSGLGMKVLLLKEAFPRLDLQLLTTTYPKVLHEAVQCMKQYSVLYDVCRTVLIYIIGCWV